MHTRINDTIEIEDNACTHTPLSEYINKCFLSYKEFSVIGYMWCKKLSAPPPNLFRASKRWGIPVASPTHICACAHQRLSGNTTAGGISEMLILQENCIIFLSI